MHKTINDSGRKYKNGKFVLFFLSLYWRSITDRIFNQFFNSKIAKKEPKNISQVQKLTCLNKCVLTYNIIR